MNFDRFHHSRVSGERLRNQEKQMKGDEKTTRKTDEGRKKAEASP